VSHDSVAVAGAPDTAGGRALIGVLAAHGIPAELHDAGSGFVDVVVPRTLRDEARKILKAHLDALARDEAPEVIAVAPDSASAFALVGALRSAGFPVTVSARGVYASRQSTGILVPHAMVPAAREFLASLEAGGGDVGSPQDEPEKEQGESVEAPWVGVSEAPVTRELESDAAQETESSAPPEAEPGHAEPADDGPPAYGSDLRPDYGDAFTPGAGGL